MIFRQNVEARQLADGNASELASWVGGVVGWKHSSTCVQFFSAGRVVTVDPGDWVVKDGTGVFNCRRHDIFAAAYVAS